MESIEHFSHPHLLTRCLIKDNEEVKCFACTKRCLNQYYSCGECRFFLHEECAKLPVEIKTHPLHADHTLILGPTAYYMGIVYCDACDNRCHGFTFRCEKCNFDLDIDCARKLVSPREGGGEPLLLKHFSHPHHGLVLKEEIDKDKRARCEACDKRCLKDTYTCSLCKFFLHKSCAELKMELRHPLHEAHVLELRTSSDVYNGRVECDSCGKRVRGFVYHCEICQFDLDIVCSLPSAPTFEPGDQKLEMVHFSHDHPLTIGEEERDIFIICAACGDDCSSSRTYGCEECEYFLHESCANLPQTMAHLCHPEHPLKLQVALYNYCDFCENPIEGFTYRCDQCDFDLDIGCTLMPSIEPGTRKQDEKIHHFSHPHSLKPTKLGLKSKCSACDGPFSESEQIYGCLDCKYFLHKSCAQLPLEKEHQYHERHPLKLQVASYDYCDFCGEKIEGFAYCCDLCDFNLDTKCVGMPSISSKTMKKVEEMKTKCFAHDHELTGSMKSRGDKIICHACGRKCTGLTYACDSDGCGFFLHKGCAELPQVYVHFAHQRHGLNLQISDAEVSCGACGEKFHGFAFSCQECNFHLDVVCAMMAEKLKHGDYISRLSHGHPLKLTKKELKGPCLACNQSRLDSGEVYGCDYCSRWLHISCTQLPPKLEHFLHRFRKRDHERECELTLEARIALTGEQGKLECAACQNACRGSVIYRCKLCDLNLDVECALMPLKIQEGTPAKVFPAGHGHPLQLCSIKEDTNSPSCSVCSIRCTDPTYRCIKCETFTVHESCAELLPSIPKCSLHSHEMDLLKKIRFTCAACLNISHGFTYDCNTCSPPFSLHIGCMNLEPIIKCGDLGHYLRFLDNIHKDDSCKTCHGVIFSCSSKEMEVETANKQGLFRCVTCKYSLHLLCGPLPCLIKSDDHRHVLQLEDKFVEDDSGEYYCDACEKRRDPDKCVYKCSEENCPYVAHFECMKPEVLRLLKGEQKEEVELRFLGGDRIYRKVMIKVQDMTEMALKNEEHASNGSRGKDIQTLEDLLDAFIQDKQTKLPGTFQTLKKETLGTGHASFWERLEASGSTAEVSPYSQQTLTQFMDRTEASIENLEFSAIFFEGEELLEVGGYRVVQSLAPILEQLLEERTHISTDSKLNLKSKSLIFNLLCGAISSMSTTQFSELSETLLHDWWNQIMMAKHAGFEIQFALDHLKEVFRAYFALRAEEIQSHRLLELEDQIGECQNQAAKAEELTRISRQYEESAEASLRQELLRKVRALEGETVGRVLL